MTLEGTIGFDQGVEHWRLEDLTVTGYPVWGVTLLGDNKDIELRRLDVSGGEAATHLTVGYSGDEPVYGPVEDVLIEDCTLSDVVYTALDQRCSGARRWDLGKLFLDVGQGLLKLDDRGWLRKGCRAQRLCRLEVSRLCRWRLA